MCDGVCFVILLDFVLLLRFLFFWLVCLGVVMAFVLFVFFGGVCFVFTVFVLVLSLCLDLFLFVSGWLFDVLFCVLVFVFVFCCCLFC